LNPFVRNGFIQQIGKDIDMKSMNRILLLVLAMALVLFATGVATAEDAPKKGSSKAASSADAPKAGCDKHAKAHAGCAEKGKGAHCGSKADCSKDGKCTAKPDCCKDGKCTVQGDCCKDGKCTTKPDCCTAGKCATKASAECAEKGVKKDCETTCKEKGKKAN